MRKFEISRYTVAIDGICTVATTFYVEKAVEKTRSMAYVRRHSTPRLSNSSVRSHYHDPKDSPYADIIPFAAHRASSVNYEHNVDLSILDARLDRDYQA